MKNLTPVLRLNMKRSTSTSAKNTTHLNKRAPLKPCHVQPTQNLPAKLTSATKYNSLKNSLLIISTVCKGVILCPGARNLDTIIAKFKSHPMLRYVQDYPPGKSPRDGQGHEKILAEQQKQLEKLKKEIKWRDSVEKFPKYKPK